MRPWSKTSVAGLRSVSVVILAALACLELVLLTVRLQNPPGEEAVHVRTGAVAVQPAMPPGSGPAAPELISGANGESVDASARLLPPAQPGSGPAARELSDAEIRAARHQGVVP